jgi:sulfite exporter TauE/SafE
LEVATARPAAPVVTDAPRPLAFVAALAAGVAIAGFWNVRLVDDFGSNLAMQALGSFEGRAAEYQTLGAGFGFFFAAVAGLAATFTACNCVAFAMIPGLACARDARAGRHEALRVLSIMAFWVAAVGAVYGGFVGWLGPDGAASINTRDVRFAQAFAVFTMLGLVMLVWGAIELRLLAPLVARCTPVTRAFFAQPTTRAALMGVMVGLFAVGRPYGVFREFLLYAAQNRSPAYGAAVMAVQGLGQILVMAALFALVAVFGYRALQRWVQRAPQQPAFVSAVALVAGGAFFIYYWGVMRLWPGTGRWGNALGLY